MMMMKWSGWKRERKYAEGSIFFWIRKTNSSSFLYRKYKTKNSNNEKVMNVNLPQMTGMDCMASMVNRGRSLVDRGYPVADVAVAVVVMGRIHCENSVEMMTDIDLVDFAAAGNSSNFDSL